MRNYILVLEHLSYIVECFCIDATGEAKQEIINLKEKLLSDPDFKIENGDAIANRFDEALKSYNNREVASTISSVCRGLWKKVMEQLNEHNLTIH